MLIKIAYISDSPDKNFDDSKKIFEKVRVLLRHGGQHDVLRAVEVGNEGDALHFWY